MRAARNGPRFLDALLRAIGRTGQRPAFDDPQARSWARRVRSYEDLPTVFRSFFDHLLFRQIEPFPYTVLMPTFLGGYGRPEIERLVLNLWRDIHVLENSEAALRTTRYPIEKIHVLERGSILLYAWITIRAAETIVFQQWSRSRLSVLLDQYPGFGCPRQASQFERC
jgi:hypothetical protein